MSGTEVNLSVVKGEHADSGVNSGTELVAFVNAVMSGQNDDLERTRDALEDKLGTGGVSDSAAVITMFNVVDRIADATGIPIDDGFTKDLRYAIGCELGMAHLTPEQRRGQ